MEESERRDKYQDFIREVPPPAKKPLEHERDGDTNCNWHARYSHQRFVQELEDLEIRARVEIIQTTALLRSARILRRVLDT